MGNIADPCRWTYKPMPISMPKLPRSMWVYLQGSRESVFKLGDAKHCRDNVNGVDLSLE